MLETQKPKPNLPVPRLLRVNRVILVVGRGRRCSEWRRRREDTFVGVATWLRSKTRRSYEIFARIILKGRSTIAADAGR